MNDGIPQSEQGLTPKDVETQRPQEIKDPRAELTVTFEEARKTLDALKDHAIKNGVQEDKIGHLSQVLNPNDYYLLPAEAMKRELIRAGEDPSRAQNVQALTAKTGEVFMSEQDAENAHPLIHESIHRAVYLVEKTHGSVMLEKQVAAVCGFTLSDKMTLDPNSPYFQGKNVTEDDIALWSSFVKQVIKQVREGLTEWTTQKGNELASQSDLVPKFNEEDSKYPDQVDWIKRMKSDMQQYAGITEERGDAIIIETALTGDISQIADQFGNSPDKSFRGYLNEAYFNPHHI